MLLPVGVDSNKCEASYKNGILTIEMPKRPETKTKTIRVQVKWNAIGERRGQRRPAHASSYRNGIQTNAIW